MEWVAKQCEAASWRALEEAVLEVNIPVRDKGKRKIIDHMEEEQKCKFREDPLVEKETIAIEVKRQKHDKLIMQR